MCPSVTVNDSKVCGQFSPLVSGKPQLKPKTYSTSSSNRHVGFLSLKPAIGTSSPHAECRSVYYVKPIMVNNQEGYLTRV